MKKIFVIILCLCLMFSVTGVFAEESVTADRPQFSRENMPQRPQFDPNNIPAGEMTQFGRGQIPESEMPQFNRNELPTQTQTEEQPMGFYGFLKTYSTPVASVVLLGLAFLFVIFYKRKNY